MNNNNNKKSEIFIPGKLNPIPENGVSFSCLLLQVYEKPQSATAKFPPPTSLHILPLSNAMVSVKPPKKTSVVVTNTKGGKTAKIPSVTDGGEGEDEETTTEDDKTITPIIALSSAIFVKMFKCPVTTLIPGSLYTLIGVTTSGWPNKDTGIMQYSFETARILPLDASLSNIIPTIPFDERKFIPERGK